MQPEDGITTRAQELGRLIGQSDEYKALKRARERMAEDREATTAANRIAELEQQVGSILQRGEQPGDEIREEYERVATTLQASPVYQGLVAAQSNLEKMLGKVDEQIAKGMEAGAQSRIILS
ncbi:MAG: YlbF family regulator [Gemmatimonadota bacterium]